MQFVYITVLLTVLIQLLSHMCMHLQAHQNTWAKNYPRLSKMVCNMVTILLHQASLLQSIKINCSCFLTKDHNFIKVIGTYATRLILKFRVQGWLKLILYTLLSLLRLQAPVAAMNHSKNATALSQSETRRLWHVIFHCLLSILMHPLYSSWHVSVHSCERFSDAVLMAVLPSQIALMLAWNEIWDVLYLV